MSPINGDDKKIGPAIGIDLGTWKCCVGIFRDGKVEIIENERGSKTTPSYVTFTESERIIGDDAKSQLALNPANTVYGVKRIIGRRFDDLSFQGIKDTFPFTVKQYDGKPFIEVIYKGKTERLCPEQVTAMFLTKMKHIAESHLGCEVKNAVISVPAHFNNAQRQATMDAGVIAGLNVLGLINEPTAAALAYRDNKGPTDKTICVVDLGGGTIDVSIIKMEGEKAITVVETHGNTSIGGMDFDQRLVKHFMDEFLSTSNYDISGNFKALERLRLACEKLKHTLSLLPTTRIQLDCLAADTDFESSITRGTFEKLCHKDFNESLYSVLTKVHSKQLDRVVLVGGSTRIPYIQELLKKVLDKSLDKSVNPDEAVAHGAAIKAALLGHEHSVQDMVVHDINSHTFEIGNKASREVVFEQNGYERRKTYTIESKNSFHAHYDLSECLFDIKTNTEISHRHVGSVMPSDVIKCYNMQYDFTIDDNGIFCGHLVDENACYRFPFDSDHLNTKDLPAMENQEKLFRTDKENEKSRLISLSDLEAYCFNKKQLVQEHSAGDSDVEKLRQVIDLCDETIDWLDSTPEATKDMCKARKKELQGFLNILVPPALEVKEVKMNTKQQPKTVDQRAGGSSCGNNSENAGGLSSKGPNSGNGDLQDPLRCDPTSRSRTWQQTSQSRVDLADEFNQKNKKKKLDELTKFSAQTSCMNMINTVHQNHNVPQQEPVTEPWKYYNDGFLSRGLPFREYHFGVPPGSSVGPRASQETGLLAEVHKPGWPTASGAISVNTGHQGGHNSRYPYSSQASGRQQHTSSKHCHFIPEKHQGSHTYFRSQDCSQKFSRDSGKTAHSSYEFSSDEEELVSYVKNRPPKKQSDSNFVVGFLSQVGSVIGSAFSSVTGTLTKLAYLR